MEAVAPVRQPGDEREHGRCAARPLTAPPNLKVGACPSLKAGVLEPSAGRAGRGQNKGIEFTSRVW